MNFEEREESEMSATDNKKQLVNGEDFLGCFSPLLNSIMWAHEQ